MNNVAPERYNSSMKAGQKNVYKKFNNRYSKSWSEMLLNESKPFPCGFKISQSRKWEKKSF